ncbi:MAG: hypothetical protein AAB407_00580 [Patescibacteria group bacterium]
MERTKIIIHKDDEVTIVAERIIDTPSTDITLAIPRFSKFASSPTHLRLLKREAEALGKTLSIESVDENILEICESEGLTSTNPFFGNEGAGHMADIAPSRRPEHRYAGHHEAREGSNHQESNHHVAPREKKMRRLLPSIPSRGKTIIGVGSVAILASMLFVGLGVLPRANVHITTEKSQRSYASVVVVAKSPDIVKTDNLILLGQVFSQAKNGSFTFTASGEGKVERKARGTVTIYNSHGSEAQQLIATTRFQAPDGKIYRIQNAVTVPGAKIEAGKVIEPGSVDAVVFADQPGDTYNVGPIEKLTIPGFKGSKKFEGFYATSKEPMAGGFIGSGVFPTDADLTAAEKSAEDALRESIKAVFISQLPAGFRFIDGASQFTLSKKDINPAVDAEGKFSIFVEGEFSAMVFKESDLLESFRGTALTEAGDSFSVADDRIDYGEPKFLKEGALELPVEYKVMLAKTVDETVLKGKIAGKSGADIRAIVFSFPGLERAQISFWPFWVQSVPDNTEKITVTLD